MAIQYISGGAAAAGAAALTVSLPTTRANDDLLLLLVETANQAVTTPTGWSIVAGTPQGVGTAAATTATRISLFYRFVDGSETNPSIADSGDHQIAQIICYRGVDPVNPFNASAGSVKSTASTTATFPGITTTKDNCLVLLAEAHALPDSNSTAIAGTRSGSNLTGLVERLDNNTNAGNGGGFSLADGLKATAGSVTGGTVALTTSTVGAHITLALQPFVELQQLTLPAETASFTVAGANANLRRTYTPLTAESGTALLSGQPVGFAKGFAFPAATGEFVATNQPAGVRTARRLLADAAASVVTGQAANLRSTRRLVAETSAFGTTGQPAALNKVFRLTCSPAAFSVAAQPAGVTRTASLKADAIAYATAGQSATVRRTVELNTDTASVAAVGREVGLRAIRRYRLTADALAVSVSLRPAALSVQRHLAAASSSYLLTLSEATLIPEFNTPDPRVEPALGELALLELGADPIQFRYVLKANSAAFSAALVDVETILDMKPAKQRPEVNGAELLWYEILGEPIPERFIETEVGAFNLTGQDAKVLYGRTVNSVVGTYTAAGQPNAFRRTYNLKASFAAFSEVGRPANLRTARRLVADVRAFAHAGQPAKILRNRHLRADVRSYAVTGVGMNFKFQRFLRPLVRSLLVSGQAASLLSTLRLRAGTGRYGLGSYFDPDYIDPGYTTNEAKLLRQFHISTDAGGFALATYEAFFRKTKLFIADGGSLAVTGYSTGLRTARRFLAEPVGYSAQPYDIGFSWQHVMRPFPVTFDVAGIDAAIRKIVTLYADGAAYTLEGYSSRPFFSSLPRAEDYVMRPMELRGTLRPVEMRQTVRPQEMTTTVRPQDLRGVIRPAEDRTSERGEESRYAEHE